MQRIVIAKKAELLCDENVPIMDDDFSDRRANRGGIRRKAKQTSVP